MEKINDVTLPPEPEEGNIEYKRHLLTINKDQYISIERKQYKFEKLKSQMQWRVTEGEGVAIYYLGVEDNGDFYNMSDNEIVITLETLLLLTVDLQYTITSFKKIKDSYEVYITDSKIKKETD
jgi:GTPase